MADSTEHRALGVILVADSEVIVRHGISDYLRACGYTVIEAATSDEVRSVLEHGEILLHAVLCDLRIQGSMNAFQLRHWISQSHSNLRVVLAGDLTGAAEAAAEFCEEGPELARPYDPQGVIAYIRRMLGSLNRSTTA